MRVAASTLAVGLLLSVALPANEVRAADPSELVMLERANFWRAQHRPDLAGDILGKILSANPRQADALYLKGSLALEQGDRGGAEQYFDRLRELAPADKRAAELVATLGAASSPPAHAAAAAEKPISAQSAAIAAVKPAPAAASAVPASSTSPAPAPVPAAAATASNRVVSAPPAQLVAVSADSEDLTPAAKPADVVVANAPARPVIAAAFPAGAQPRQIAALPAMTISDGDTVVSPTAPATRGTTDLGTAARGVQLSQVELQAPPPIGGYQPIGALRPYSPSDTLEVYIERDLEQIQMQANPTLIAGIGIRTHSGTEGTGRLFEIGAADQVTFSPWYTGTASIAVMPVYLDAGTPANGNLTNFGANPILAVNGIANASARQQNAFGVGLLGTYTYGDFSGQFGTTPLGFPVVNLIGDLAYAPKFMNGNLTVRLEGFRQPVTDSVISYAGTHASLVTANTFVGGAFGNNTLFGGVVKTGPRVSIYYDDQYFGAYGGAGYSWLTGTNVVDNAAVDAQLGAYFRPYKNDYLTLRVGASVFYSAYDKNVSGSTFGQGGYFSPQDFEGIGFPLEVTGSYGQWSYLLSPTLGVQHFNAHASPIFPLTPAAQLTMQALAPNFAYNPGLHGGWGFGFNIKGQVEYAVDKTLSFGAAASVNNSNNYDEGIFQVYLRKTFDWFAPLAFRNDPQSIAARDMPMSRL